MKPQFEVGRSGLDDRGVVRSEQLRRDALSAVIEDAVSQGWSPRWQAESQLPGETGNVEYFVEFVRSA